MIVGVEMYGLFDLYALVNFYGWIVFIWYRFLKYFHIILDSRI